MKRQYGRDKFLKEQIIMKKMKRQEEIDKFLKEANNDEENEDNKLVKNVKRRK